HPQRAGAVEGDGHRGSRYGQDPRRRLYAARGQLCGSKRTTVALRWLTTHRRCCESNARPIGPLSEPRVGVITLLAALVPELARAPGANASSKESSSLATHRLPAASNATPARVVRPALGVVTIVAGTR